MKVLLQSVLFALGLFVGTLICLRAGWLVGRQRLSGADSEAAAGLSAVDGAMLGLLVLVSSLLAGFGMAKAARQSRLHVLAFAVILSTSIYLILDIEYPRLGLIRVDRFDQALVDLRATMN